MIEMVPRYSALARSKTALGQMQAASGTCGCPEKALVEPEKPIWMGGACDIHFMPV